MWRTIYRNDHISPLIIPGDQLAFPPRWWDSSPITGPGTGPEEDWRDFDFSLEVSDWWEWLGASGQWSRVDTTGVYVWDGTGRNSPPMPFQSGYGSSAPPYLYMVHHTFDVRDAWVVHHEEINW
jgi:hypothetical protein